MTAAVSPFPSLTWTGYEPGGRDGGREGGRESRRKGRREGRRMNEAGMRGVGGYVVRVCIK